MVTILKGSGEFFIPKFLKSYAVFFFFFLFQYDDGNNNRAALAFQYWHGSLSFLLYWLSFHPTFIGKLLVCAQSFQWKPTIWILVHGWLYLPNLMISKKKRKRKLFRLISIHMFKIIDGIIIIWTCRCMILSFTTNRFIFSCSWWGTYN